MAFFVNAADGKELAVVIGRASIPASKVSKIFKKKNMQGIIPIRHG